MIITSLYIKQHNTTGKLYFGKTSRQDVKKYPGSGVYWKRHLNEHGNDVSTIWKEQFTNCSEIVEFATFFSDFFEIVDSDKWANLIPELGVDGFPPGGKMPPRSAEHITNWSNSKTGWIPMESTRKLWADQRRGRVVTESTRAKHSANTTGKNNPNALEWEIYYPTGEVKIVVGLQAFCRENNLPFRKIYHSIDGWKSVKNGTGKGGRRKVNK